MFFDRDRDPASRRATQALAERNIAKWNFCNQQNAGQGVTTSCCLAIQSPANDAETTTVAGSASEVACVAPSLSVTIDPDPEPESEAILAARRERMERKRDRQRGLLIVGVAVFMLILHVLSDRPKPITNPSAPPSTSSSASPAKKASAVMPFVDR